MELVDFLGRFDCRRLPTKDNVKNVIVDIAHKELVQKAKFISESWSTVIRPYPHSISTCDVGHLLSRVPVDQDISSAIKWTVELFRVWTVLVQKKTRGRIYKTFGIPPGLSAVFVCRIVCLFQFATTLSKSSWIKCIKQNRRQELWKKTQNRLEVGREGNSLAAEAHGLTYNFA